MFRNVSKFPALKAVRACVLRLFSVAVISVSYLAGQVSIFAAKYRSIVIAVSMVAATCLLKVDFCS